MKKIIIILLAFGFIFQSCLYKNEEGDPVIGVFTAPVLDNVAGNYTLTVQGRPAALNSGFTGQLVFRAATSAVPEPGTWAMMLLGMGAVGWALRRNREAGGARRLSLA